MVLVLEVVSTSNTDYTLLTAELSCLKAPLDVITEYMEAANSHTRREEAVTSAGSRSRPASRLRLMEARHLSTQGNVSSFHNSCDMLLLFQMKQLSKIYIVLEAG